MRVAARRWFQVGSIAALLVAPIPSAAAPSVPGHPAPTGEAGRCVAVVHLAGATVDPSGLASRQTESRPSEAAAVASLLITPIQTVLLVVLVLAIIAAWHTRVRTAEIELAKLALRDVGGAGARGIAARCDALRVLLEPMEKSSDERVQSAARALRRDCEEFCEAVDAAAAAARPRGL
jgi:hypothetical protein